jgi:hypothetical protein
MASLNICGLQQHNRSTIYIGHETKLSNLSKNEINRLIAQLNGEKIGNART